MTDQTPETYAVLRERHAKGFASTADEAWGRDPVCTGCEHQWPCDTAAALDLVEKMRGDVHHHVNPNIGMLRYVFEKATGTDPFDIDQARSSAFATLPEKVSLSSVEIVNTVHALQAATDAADAALDEEPMRVQIARVQAEAVAARTAQS